jgi:hypothetical protein
MSLVAKRVDILRNYEGKCLKGIDKLYEIYPQIEHCLPSFLKLHKALKKNGLNPRNV